MEVVLNGLATGLVLATFTGPIFFMLLNLGLQGRVKAAGFLALGTFVSDIFTVVLLTMLAQPLKEHTMVLNGMYLVGGAILVYIGIQHLLARPHMEFLATETGLNKQMFWRGLMINGTNPNVFFFWFGAVAGAYKTYSGSITSVFIHFSAALFVVLSTDFGKGWAASFLQPYVTDRLLSIISKISGMVIIVFGLRLIFFH